MRRRRDVRQLLRTGISALRNWFATGEQVGRGLVTSGNVLYGTTSAGGSSNKGTIFKLNADGTGYAVLKHFSGSDGARPQATLVLSGGMLYGTTYMGSVVINSFQVRQLLVPGNRFCSPYT